MKNTNRLLDVVSRKKTPYSFTAGSPLPQGVHLHKEGINFSIFSRHATRVWLLIYSDIEAKEPFQTIELERQHHKTGDIWHVCVRGGKQGLVYAYKVEGPIDPENGHRFDGSKILVDPYATALTSPREWDFSGYCGSYNETEAPEALVKGVVTGHEFDWENDRPLNHEWSDLVIYETHVRGLTIHPTSGTRHPGTYLGLIDKIPYLKQLGINAIELMPMQEYNPCEITATNPETGKRLHNYWGYNTIAFFAPHEGYGTRLYPGCQVDEFKTMVKALHKAGIEVLLDVVFNHTAEGDHSGPTLNFRGLDNSIYYILEEDKKLYKNYSGCGNTLNCNHPVVRSYILDCLRYWVVEMHVDGFRFDLASILGRDRNGQLIPDPPLLEKIAEDPILRGVKLIAEAWDAGGAYLVGRFPGERWSEWNGQYRDDVRRFWRGDPCMAGALASRICGSADIYEHNGKAPVNSINFITCHDGFTLNDLVSYNHKHNLANGENNRDGTNADYSANYGCEGQTDDTGINRIRLRQMKNMMATLFISRGVPMILGGDEFCRTQQGNNNAYCQDNEISWFDWSLIEKNREFHDFVRNMIHFRRQHPALSSEKFYSPSEISWFNPQGWLPDWQSDAALGCHIHPLEHGNNQICLLTNPFPHAVSFPLPIPPEGCFWHKMVDTSAPPPFDICQPGKAIPLARDVARTVPDRSMLILVAEKY